MSNFVNFDDFVRDKEADKLRKKWNPMPHARLLPRHPFRLLIAGGTGCGKSNETYNFLLNDEYKLYYDKIYFLTPDPTEDKNVYLKNYFEEKKRIVEREFKKQGIHQKVPDVVHFFTDPNELPELSEDLRQSNECSILIVDDAVLDKQTNKIVQNYIIKCRKFGMSLIYLSQSVYDVPKLIRANTNYFSVYDFKDSRMLNNFYQTWGGDVTKEQFRNMYRKATKKPFRSFVIDKSNHAVINPELKYRAGWDILLT